MTPSILIIYTGGTIGMTADPETGALQPFDFERISEQVPELRKFGYRLETFSFNEPIDSSNVQPAFWAELAEIIETNYDNYHGFVILHGTDTMSFTASALSFMLENLQKPVVLTGSQLPIGMLRTDGKENLITAIEVAAARQNNQPLVPEVVIYFEYKLFRGNRTTKYNAEYFDAFQSPNYPLLARAGISIDYKHKAIHYPVTESALLVHKKLASEVGILKIFPGITPQFVETVLRAPGLKGLVLETFGSGNAPTLPWFIQILQAASEKGLVIANVSQCSAGSVNMELYETGVGLQKAGVISGHDLTTEAAITKLMFLFGRYQTAENVRVEFEKSIAGEMSLTK